MNASAYLQERLESLGLTLETNWFHFHQYNEELDEYFEKVQIPLYEHDSQGNILLNVCDINRRQPYYPEEEAKRRGPSQRVRMYPYQLKRLRQPKADMKYVMPKGQGTMPFIPESVIEKYEQGLIIDTLFFTEGYFKAQKGAMCGLDIIGLSSIQHYRERATDGTGVFYKDCTLLIERCKVSKIVLLHDADCLDISQKAIKNKQPLDKRPAAFYNAAQGFQEAVFDVCNRNDISIYYAHVRPDLAITYPHAPAKLGTDTMKLAACVFPKLETLQSPKGLDDLLIAGDEEEIVADLNTWSPLETKYFVKLNITKRSAKLRSYFGLTNVDIFYNRHAQIIGDKEFIYSGTTYIFDTETSKMIVLMPKEAEFYYRIGVDYYKKVLIPNKYSDVEAHLKPWSKPTIIEDHNKSFLQHIKKLESFCNVPSHRDYQPIIKNCYNLYSPFVWQPAEGSTTLSMQFIKHIFGTHTVKDVKGKSYDAWELGLDYLQLLYQKPTHVLPILALVSREQETGKTTFGKWLKRIFADNAAWVSNDDWSNNFNGPWANKLLILTEEALLEKKALYEKIKALSTGDKIQVNRKGKDQNESDFFGKFIFFSNNEENFMYVEENEKRFWVLKVQSIPKSEQSANFDEELFAEIPALLHMLDSRSLVTKWSNRQWFDYGLTNTEALRKVIAHSVPKVQRLVKDYMTEAFIDIYPEDGTILMTPKIVNQIVLQGKHTTDLAYVADVLTNKMGLQRYTNAAGKEVAKRYQYIKVVETDAGTRHLKLSDVGRPFVFPREMFITPEINTKMEAGDAIENHDQNDQNTPTPMPTEDLPF